eukprot:12767892-Alexandrium_andersonii.AAC.1
MCAGFALGGTWIQCRRGTPEISVSPLRPKQLTDYAQAPLPCPSGEPNTIQRVRALGGPSGESLGL